MYKAHLTLMLYVDGTTVNNLTCLRIPENLNKRRKNSKYQLHSKMTQHSMY